MKSPYYQDIREFQESLSLWREWIEIKYRQMYGKWAKGLSLYGESGLKSAVAGGGLAKETSLSLWREWIEISIFENFVAGIGSLSLWREWIEIALTNPDKLVVYGLSLYGESGLKYSPSRWTDKFIGVSLFMERVD